VLADQPVVSRKRPFSGIDDDDRELLGSSATLPPAASKDQISLQRNGRAHEEDGFRYGTYNAGMMLDEQLDEEMNSEYRYQSSWLVHLMYSQMLSSSYPHLTTISSKFLIFGRCVLLSLVYTYYQLNSLSLVVHLVRRSGLGHVVPSPFTQWCHRSFG
jgi:hypothetical protein